MERTVVAAMTAMVAGALLTLSTVDTSAGEISRSGSYTGARGATIERQVTRGSGQRTVNQRVQRPNGASRARSSTTTRNEDGTLTRQSNTSATGAKGGTLDRSCTGGACTGSGTTAAGKDYTTSGTVTRNEDGTFTRQGTIAGQNGGSLDRSCTGGACTGTVTTAAGKEVTTSSTVTRNEDGTVTRAGTITGPNGNTTDFSKTR